MAAVLIGSARIDERGKGVRRSGREPERQGAEQAGMVSALEGVVLLPGARRRARGLHRRGHGKGHLKQEHRLRPKSEPDAVQSGQAQGV